ncbi:CRISPR-associated endonuclease Cas2 [Desulfobacter hydrogenophilus]|uniref:CRISPR-associated endonuclease Cas2 n=1 Tax=Desulfobacter hydrogenophilus TaxID=2291 RepID=UPI001F5EEE75|nr:CRISPR-associated endonuclease Cas2 [Desulfobacter hydrogenophilus]
MFFLVCFDIVDNRFRYRVVKILKGYGTRVQKSAFECANMNEYKFTSYATFNIWFL